VGWRARAVLGRLRPSARGVRLIPMWRASSTARSCRWSWWMRATTTSIPPRGPQQRSHRILPAGILGRQHRAASLGSRRRQVADRGRRGRCLAPWRQLGQYRHQSGDGGVQPDAGAELEQRRFPSHPLTIAGVRVERRCRGVPDAASPLNSASSPESLATMEKGPRRKRRGQFDGTATLRNTAN